MRAVVMHWDGLEGDGHAWCCPPSRASPSAEAVLVLGPEGREMLYAKTWERTFWTERKLSVNSRLQGQTQGV